MARELKVFGYTIAVSREENEALGQRTHHRQARAVVAVTTKKEAAEKFGINGSTARDFMCETGNAREIKQAMSQPGQVFAQPLNHSDGDPFIKIERKKHEPIKRVKRPSFEEMMARRAEREAAEAAKRFTPEELRYMVEMFAGANNPVAASIAMKAQLRLDA